MKPLILSPGIADGRPKASLYYGEDVRKTLQRLDESSVHTVCTSPPYWGLRDYGTGDKQIGLEDSPAAFTQSLVEVFREIKRVLRPDGTIWVNLGDSYAAARGGSHQPAETLAGGVGGKTREGGKVNRDRHAGYNPSRDARAVGLKHKDLVGIPWRVALALQDDGWYLRNDIIWAKGNPMPESVKDRCTRAHEYIFLFAHPDSQGKYYYDQDAIREPLKAASLSRNKYEWKSHQRTHDPRETRGRNDRDHVFDESVGSNKRTVWNVNPKSYRGAHFATWPPDLVRPMILAGCPRGGVVMDPFSGSATTGMVALQEGRNYIGIDLNADYLNLATARVEGRNAPKEADAAEAEQSSVFDMFGDSE